MLARCTAALKPNRAFRSCRERGSRALLLKTLFNLDSALSRYEHGRHRILLIMQSLFQWCDASHILVCWHMNVYECILIVCMCVCVYIYMCMCNTTLHVYIILQLYTSCSAADLLCAEQGPSWVHLECDDDVPHYFLSVLKWAETVSTGQFSAPVYDSKQ